MTHIVIDLQGTTNGKPTEFTCVVPEDNPYDDGYLLNPAQAGAVLSAWVAMDHDSDVKRGYRDHDESGFTTALVMEGDLIMAEWPSTTDHHNFETGNQSMDLGEPAYSTSHWPFDFDVEEAMESSAVINRALMLTKQLESALSAPNSGIAAAYQKVLREAVASIRKALEVPYND